MLKYKREEKLFVMTITIKKLLHMRYNRNQKKVYLHISNITELLNPN